MARSGRRMRRPAGLRVPTWKSKSGVSTSSPASSAHEVLVEQLDVQRVQGFEVGLPLLVHAA